MIAAEDKYGSPVEVRISCEDGYNEGSGSGIPPWPYPESTEPISTSTTPSTVTWITPTSGQQAGDDSNQSKSSSCGNLHNSNAHRFIFLFSAHCWCCSWCCWLGGHCCGYPDWDLPVPKVRYSHPVFIDAHASCFPLCIVSLEMVFWHITD